jgi:DNA repair exonuclease SbcCD ATPase subunit
MRIKTIELSWFRGAGSLVTLDTLGKSVVIYGSNGSGKSSFADALEYIISNGKIHHLSHEYSGPKQRDGIRNTHAPEDVTATIKISCDNQRQLVGSIASNGQLRITCEPSEGTTELFQCLDLERFVLRQDEVAKFIHATKGDKYSALLPLLGLEEMENAAENFKNLRKTVEVRSDVILDRQKLDQFKILVSRYINDISYESAMKFLVELAGKYLETPYPDELIPLLIAIDKAVEERIEKANPEQERHILIQQIVDEDLQGKFDTFYTLQQKAYEEIGALLDQQIAVLESTDTYLQIAKDGNKQIECPACGREIDTREFVLHVQEELVKLREIRTTRDDLKNARRNLMGALDQVTQKSQEQVLEAWFEESSKEVKQALMSITEVQLEDEIIIDSGQLDVLRLNIPIIHEAFSSAAELVPPSTKELVFANEVVTAFNNLPEIFKLEKRIRHINYLINGLQATEDSIRDAIKTKTKTIIQDVSQEIQILWEKIHPNEQIEEVQLYIPKDADKAIDICLKFYGIDQASPRLSLSEGHRNSLGLCIFLALVKMGNGGNHPIVLDDVISSLDREHRGRLAKILIDDFADYQVIVLTHDREWYSELKARLPTKKWVFQVLKPWQDPDIGIQWSQSTDTFDDARALIEIDPTSAGNRTRAIMDTQMSIAAEKLYVNVPFARGDRNDHRTCVEFLERTMSMAKKSFRKKNGDEYIVYQVPIADWDEARNLLIAWGNRASHTGTLTTVEAKDFIMVCEKALSHFRCTECGDSIWMADQRTRQCLQCSCGFMQWKYG